jgi:hypothetical protein
MPSEQHSRIKSGTGVKNVSLRVNRRVVMASALPSLALSAGCTHAPKQVQVLVDPSSKLRTVDLYYVGHGTSEGGGDAQVPGYFGEPFKTIFEGTAPKVLQHNGLAGRGVFGLPRMQPSEPHVVLAPFSYEYWRGHVRVLFLRSALYEGSSGKELLRWQSTISFPPVGMRLQAQDYQAGAENIVLQTLSALGTSAYAVLRFSPPQNERGATNPYLATVRM